MEEVDPKRVGEAVRSISAYLLPRRFFGIEYNWKLDRQFKAVVAELSRLNFSPSETRAAFDKLVDMQALSLRQFHPGVENEPLYNPGGIRPGAPLYYAGHVRPGESFRPATKEAVKQAFNDLSLGDK